MTTQPRANIRTSSGALNIAPFYPTLEQSDKRLLKLINNYYGRNNK